MASEVDGLIGVLVYMTQYVSLSVGFPTATVSFRCAGITPKEVTICLAAMHARLFPFICVRPRILRSYVGSPRLVR